MSFKKIERVLLVILYLILLNAIDQMLLQGKVSRMIVGAFALGLQGLLILILSLLHQILIVLVPLWNRLAPIIFQMLAIVFIAMLLAPLFKDFMKKMKGDGGGGGGQHK